MKHVEGREPGEYLSRLSVPQVIRRKPDSHDKAVRLYNIALASTDQPLATELRDVARWRWRAERIQFQEITRARECHPFLILTLQER